MLLFYILYFFFIRIEVDIDPNKIEFVNHNAAVYGVDVERRVQFYRDDLTDLAVRDRGPALSGDVVFMSPPWGGPGYSKEEKFDMKKMPIDGQSLFDIGKKIAPKVVMFLPRNVNVNHLKEMAQSESPAWSLEIERNFLNDKFKAVTAYFTKPHTSECSVL